MARAATLPNQSRLPRRSRSAPLRLVFIGWGAINSRVGDLLRERGEPVEIAAIATIDSPEARSQMPEGVEFLASEDQLRGLKPDLVVEAAGRAAILQWGPAALAAAPAVILASTSALADDGVLAKLADLADRHGSRIEIPSGAIGGLDALASAAVLGLDDVVHQIVKPPRAWKATPAERLLDLERMSERAVFFSGTARQAAADYPQNANATVVTALAGIGMDRTRVEMIADPAATMNGHRIAAKGAFGRMEITLENRPLVTNPKSSELTALSLVRLIEHRINLLVI
ncbi:aspartate dehydrogenase [Rhodopseudomonas sp. HC1]|uniref:aspartate dehydrogenase n=1 Tax=Rhodopseudomonas infernalis TaxID=2897386 RepID=UPI001EE907ED|nr:aspartate dehydrogenase [Rhodopseudomonas infernalis]MCG6205235.1 aspartate dehydrogenase [Rhodopseudomonas infernalis]